MVTNQTPKANPLPPQTLHVYRLDLRRPHPEKGLSHDEVAQAKAFRLPHLGPGYRRCRATLRRLLGHYLGCPPDQVQFTYNDYGKPSLNPHHHAHLAFNVTHTGPWAIMVFYGGQTVGVDLERIHPIPEQDVIAQHHFSVREYQSYRTLPPAAREQAFYTLWTRKEAFVKAVEEGLSFPLQRFDVSFLPHDPPHIQAIRPPQPHDWRLLAFHFQEDTQRYIGAIAWLGELQHTQCFHQRLDGAHRDDSWMTWIK